MPRITGWCCQTCGLPLPDGGAHCHACRTSPRVHYETIRSAAEYRGSIRDLIHSFKYRHRDHLYRVFGRMLIEVLAGQPYRKDIDYVVPVPMHPLKRYLRGYNQSELISIPVASFLRRPVLSRVLVRRKYTRPQFTLRKNERRENLAGSFAVVHPAFIRGKNLLLIDDICTTGATINECAGALRRAGARRVYALTIARD